MRLYFNLANSTDSIPDLHGIDVLDLQEARREAQRTLVQLLQQQSVLFDEIRGWRLEATDAAGGILFTIPLDRLLA